MNLPLTCITWAGILFSWLLLNFPVPAENIILKPELAILSGTHFSDAGTGYCGKGFVSGFTNESNSLVWKFTATEGNYDLQIAYRSPFGHKEFSAVLNGDHWAGVFSHDPNFLIYDAGMRHLNNGTNALKISGGMGWYDINQANFFSLSNTLAAKNPIALARPNTIQLDVNSLLNARPVTISSQGKAVPWTEGLDGEWSGVATLSAAEVLGTPTPNALPNDGRFRANTRHPEVALNFSDADADSPQVRRSQGEDSYHFEVPPGCYSRLFLFCMSANGPSQLNVALSYQDGSVDQKALEVPDWFNPISEDDPVRFNLAGDLAKWNKTRQMSETNHHYLYGIELNPRPRKILHRVTINKLPAGTLTFWGATAVNVPD